MALPTLVLCVDPEGSIHVRTFVLSTKNIREVTGGDFKQYPGPSGSEATVFVPSDGKAEGRAYNWVATTWLRPVMHPADTIHGSIVVAGPPDFEGHPSSATDEATTVLMGLAEQAMSLMAVAEWVAVDE